eukprot:11006630-Heterocapsa_arctica.AAC.1
MKIPGAEDNPAQHSSSSSSSVDPGMLIPAQHSSSSSRSVYPGRLIPRTMDYPAAGLAERPHYSEHPT